MLHISIDYSYPSDYNRLLQPETSAPNDNMQTTSSWGYKVLEGNRVNFYHVLLSQLSFSLVYTILPKDYTIRKEQDGSITVFLNPYDNPEELIKKLVGFFTEKSYDFLQTPKYRYNIPFSSRKTLISWAHALQGCLALLLLADKETEQYFHDTWEFINVSTGGLFLAPFTVFLYKEFPKITHPIAMHNYQARKTIEQKSSFYIRKMIKRIEEAQQGLEGIALLSLIEEKTNFSKDQVAALIYKKSLGVQLPRFSPFFSDGKEIQNSLDMV